MTTKERLIKVGLVDNGMWPSQAEAVFKIALPELEGDDGHKVTWDRPAEDYPDAMYAVWVMILKPIALDWIDANQPKAFFRPMFTPNPEEEIKRLRNDMA